MGLNPKKPKELKATMAGATRFSNVLHELQIISISLLWKATGQSCQSLHTIISSLAFWPNYIWQC